MIAVIVTSYWRHGKILDRCLSLVRSKADFLVCGFDCGNHNPEFPWMHLVDLAIVGRWGKNPRFIGEYQATCAALNYLIRNFKGSYVFKLNGDVLVERPQEVPGLVDILGDYDVVGPQWHVHKSNLATLFFFGKMEKICQAYLGMDLSCPPGDQLERKWKASLDKFGIRYRILPMGVSAEEQGRIEDNGIWGEGLGIRHTHECLSSAKNGTG